MLGMRKTPEPMADLFLDADIGPELATLIAAKGHDAGTTEQHSRYDASDAEQLLRATDLGRLLVTHDRRDYVLLCRLWRRLADRWSADSVPHAGVLIVPQRDRVPLARVALELDRLLVDAPDLWGQVLRFDSKWGWTTEL